MNKPIERRSLWLTPGQRAELLVDLSDGCPVALRTGPDPTFGMGMMEMMSGMGEPLDGPTTVLRLEPQAGLPGTTSRIPEHLVEREPLDYTRAVRRRQVRLTMGMGGMMGRGGMIGGGMGPGMMGGMMRRGMGSPGMIAMFGIDDRPYDTERIDQTIRLGDMEVWEVSGDMMTHPFHMHGVHFEVLIRGGSRPSMGDQGLKDTVLVQEPVELLVHFTQPAKGVPFVYHCHTLEQEDGGMMGQYKTA